LAEFSAGVEIPYMSSNTYHSIERVLQEEYYLQPGQQ